MLSRLGINRFGFSFLNSLRRNIQDSDPEVYK